MIKMQQAKAVPLDAGTARWIWRSGRTRSSAVPWNVEVLNTDPDNFIWEQDKVCGHAMCLMWALHAQRVQPRLLALLRQERQGAGLCQQRPSRQVTLLGSRALSAQVAEHPQCCA